jgi:hypothetical protein
MPNMRKLKIDKIILGERRRQLVQELIAWAKSKRAGAA